MSFNQQERYRELADFLRHVGKDPSRLVFEDELTGISNRRFLLRYFENVRWSSGEDFPISLLALDLDKFKQINDRHGHDAGDQVLVWFATLLDETVNEAGFPIRYGGDEFVLVLPSLNRDQARQVAHGLLQTIRDRPFVLREQGTALPITVSIGIASAPRDATTGKSLFQAADAALYHAKKSGRNQVASASEINLEHVFEKTALNKLRAIGLTGRERELAQISDCLEDLAQAIDQFVVIDGTPGIGKTAFLATIREQLSGEERFKIAHVSGVQQESYRPYYLAGRVLMELLHDLGQEAGEVLASLSPVETAYLSRVLPQLEVENTGSADEDEIVMREGIFAVLVQLFPRLVGEKPLVLLVDDLQFSDEASLMVLRTVMLRSEVSLFVCGTSLELAAEKEAPPLKRFLVASQQELGIQRIQLRPLSSIEIKSHLEGIFPGLKMTENFEQDLADITQGNPLFISEIIRKLVSEQKITFFGQQWAILPLDEGYLPRSLEEIVQQKIGELDLESRQLLEQASTFGEEVSLSALSSSSEVEEAKVLEFLDRAEALGLVRLGFQVNDEILHFLGKQVLEISYGSIEEERRQELHERVGVFQETLHEKKLLPSASLLAYQFKRSANQEKARRYEQMQSAYSSAVFNAGEALTYTGEPVEAEPQKGTPLDDGALRSIPDVIRALLTTVRSIQLYPPESDAVGNSRRRAGDAIHKILEGSSALNFSLAQRVLRVNDKELDSTGFNSLADSLVELLFQSDIRTLVFLRGVTETELGTLLTTVATLKREQIEPGFWKRFSREKKLKHIEVRQVRYSAVGDTDAAGESAADLTRGKEQALEAEDISEIPAVLRTFMGSAMNSRLYPPGSQQIVDSIDEFHRSVKGILDRRQILSLATIDDFLLANGIKVNIADFEALARSFFDLTGAVGLRSLTMSANLRKSELESFFETLRDLPTSGTQPEFWTAFNRERGLKNLVVNHRHYRLRVGYSGVFVASTDLPGASDDGAGSLPVQPMAERPVAPMPELDMDPSVGDPYEHAGEPIEGAPDVPRDAIPRFGKDLLVRGDDKVFVQLVRRVFEEYPELEQTERVELIQSCATLFDDLILALQHRFADLATESLISALADEEASSVLGEIADLLHRMAEGAIRFSDYHTSSRIFAAITSRRFALAESEDPAERRCARILDRPLNPALQELVIEDLRSGETSRQERAAQILGSLGSGSIPLLIESIKQEKDLRVRQLSAGILADLGPAAVRAIKRALTFEVTVEQRFHILEVIDVITRDLRDELTLCIGDNNPKIRRAAFRLAERLGDDDLIEVLIPFVRDEDAGVAKGTIRSLSNLRSPTAVAAVESILDATKEPELAVACCQALGQIADPAGIDALEKVASPKGFLWFGKRWGGQVRATAVLALREIDDPRAAEILGRLADDKDPIIRKLVRSSSVEDST
jgi:diguanylate cyclase (GGDEF)-like protein